jgi:atypical dual specificity phosphatase
MWSWSLNWGEITPTIVVGTCPRTPDDIAKIHAEAEVSAILCLQHDDCHRYWSIDFRALTSAARGLGLAVARHPIRDFDIDDMRRRLPSAIALLAHLQMAGHRTYVHCTAGLGRAPLTVLGFLTLVEGLDPEEAIGLILRGRPGAVPAWEAYRGCVADLTSRQRASIQRRAYELYRGGTNSDAAADWRQAQAEVLRGELLRMSKKVGSGVRSNDAPESG